MRIPVEIVLATENSNKAREMMAILRRFLPDDVKISSLADFPGDVVLPEETGETFCANAVLKAESVAAAVGAYALGDDSGLCVACLGGAPGLYSRRWSGVEDTDSARNEKLLTSMANSGSNDRTALFVCCMALSGPGLQTVSATGECRGSILFERRGTSGFGYDPLFLLEGTDRTLAELNGDEKNKISHRAHAIENLIFEIGWAGPEFTRTYVRVE